TINGECNDKYASKRIIIMIQEATQYKFVPKNRRQTCIGLDGYKLSLDTNCISL
ncbi:6240_t:CDS:2, partial [Dentiscutata heterogama]